MSIHGTRSSHFIVVSEPWRSVSVVSVLSLSHCEPGRFSRSSFWTLPYCIDSLTAEMSVIESWADRTAKQFDVSGDVIQRATDLFVQQLSQFSEPSRDKVIGRYRYRY